MFKNVPKIVKMLKNVVRTIFSTESTFVIDWRLDRNCLAFINLRSPGALILIKAYAALN